VDVALYRTLAGKAVAVRNRCPHRSFPLSKGRLEGDVLVCGYHGMQFGPSGHCVNMPSMPIVPSNANVRSFPTVERGPLIWIWMGDADHADESLVPDTAWLASPEWKTVSGGFHLQSDYVAMHENLLDQTHFPFLHPGAIGTPAYADSYWVFDAMAAYSINKNIDLRLNVYNLGDKDYVQAINKSGYRYTPGAPRSASLTANFKF